jgi:hypothetical protein
MAQARRERGAVDRRLRFTFVSALLTSVLLGSACNHDPGSGALGWGGDVSTGASSDPPGPEPSPDAPFPDPGTSSAGDSAPPADSEPDSDGPDAPRFDVGAPDGDGDGVPCASDGEFSFSYIWIANSFEGTVSKIDTQTTDEVARYATGTGMPNPSRTSVNLLGDVAVVNRGNGPGEQATSGSVVKIAAELERCVDRDADGVIRTSSGPDDVLPWGEDECVLWSSAIAARDGGDQPWNEGPRPVAWEPALDETECSIGENPRLWVGWYDGANGAARIRRLDGATGDVLDEIGVPGWAQDQWGPYGGAVDRDGDFWVIGYGSTGKVLHVDAQTLAVEVIDNPGPGYSFYGMALDADGGLWIGGRDGAIVNYDPGTGTWTNLGQPGGIMRGVAVDRQGRAWVVANGPCRLIEVDVATRTVVDADVPIPGCMLPVGVSIDVEGYVWIVDQWAMRAYKMDPDTHAVIVSPAMLSDPYTYSDMTGAGLDLVAHPPAG